MGRCTFSIQIGDVFYPPRISMYFECIVQIHVFSVYYLRIIVYLIVFHSEECITMYFHRICLVFPSISKSAVILVQYAPNTHAIH